MSVTAWTGASSTAFGTAGNWSNGVPITGDTAIFFGTPANNLTTDLSQGAVALNRLVVHTSFTGTIGVDAANPLVINVNNGSDPRAIINGSGTVSLNTTATSIGVNTTGTVNLDGGTITSLSLEKGTVTLVSGLTVTTLYCGYVTTPASDVDLTIESSVTITTANVTGGAVTASMSPATINMLAGSWTQDDTGNLTTLNLFGGTFTWVDSGGNTLTTLNAYGGTFDGRPSFGANTITTINIIGTSAVVYVDAIGATTVTNSPRLFASGATTYNLTNAVLNY